ncbi:MAG: type I glyceraldehyde-3-phosphate dehydrogenase, partial [Clostridia bacterium]|nr:type I glyceraldehyde-3-phosphate dehydrogenase [Clostridia bacterium]
MAAKVGINGFGRIGRLVFRAAIKNPDIIVTGINDPFLDVDYMSYLLRYDTVHGKFDGEVKVEDGKLIVNGEVINVYNCMDPK